MHLTLQHAPQVPRIPIINMAQPKPINATATWSRPGICLTKSPRRSNFQKSSYYHQSQTNKLQDFNGISCSVRLYLQLFVRGLMSYLRYLCLFAYSSVHNTYCVVFFALIWIILCTLCCQLLWIVHF